MHLYEDTFAMNLIVNSMLAYKKNLRIHDIYIEYIFRKKNEYNII